MRISIADLGALNAKATKSIDVQIPVLRQDLLQDHTFSPQATHPQSILLRASSP